MKIVRPRLTDKGLIKFNLYLGEGCIVNGWLYNPKSHAIHAPYWPGGVRIVNGTGVFWKALQRVISETAMPICTSMSPVGRVQT